MTDTAIAAKLQTLTDAVLALVQQTAPRMSREDVCRRMGVHRITLAERLKRDATLPRPGPDGKWSRADVLAWELRNATPAAEPNQRRAG